MTYGDLLCRVQEEHLTIFGTLLGARGTILLLGPHEPGFWPVLCDSPEWQDGAADPVDRWSRRVITGLAGRLGAQAHFPFGAQPAPFLTWAMASDRAWDSVLEKQRRDSTSTVSSPSWGRKHLGEAPVQAILDTWRSGAEARKARNDDVMRSLARGETQVAL